MSLKRLSPYLSSVSGVFVEQVLGELNSKRTSILTYGEVL